MSSSRKPFRVLLLALLPTLAAAAPSPPPAVYAPWTFDDIATMQMVRQLEISADGNIAAWIETGVARVKGEEKRLGKVMLRRLDEAGAKNVQLTRGQANVTAIALSPDGAHLAFSTDRKDDADGDDAKVEGDQVWVLPLRGGEAWRLTAFDTGVELFDWAGNDALVVARAESAGIWSQEQEKRKDEALVIDDEVNTAPVRLFRVGLDGETRRLTGNRDRIDQLSVAPDGKNALITAQQSLTYGFNGKVPPRTFLVDLESGERRELLAGSRLLPILPVFAADGKAVYFADYYSSHELYRTAGVRRLHRLDLASGEAVEIPLGTDRGLADELPVIAGWGGSAGKAEHLMVALADGVRQRPFLYTRTPAAWQREPIEGAKLDTLGDFVISRDGRRLLFTSSKPDRPLQVFTARLDGARLADERQLSELNPGFADKDKGRYEVVRWKGAQGEEVEGLLMYPFGWQEGKRYPLVLDIHGGPAAADTETWNNTVANSNNQLWRERGAFVFQINYHGSSSYGLAWVESIKGRYYELEIPDIEKGVDALIARGLVDADRLAATGWSNGGILTAELITRTRRYQAAVVGAADVEWISDWGNVDFGATFDNYYFGGPPWERKEHYLEKSPFFRLSEVTTPTLIHTGTLDTNVPPHQSWSLFRALQDIGKAPVRFLTYPGEPHGLQKIAHRRRRMAEDYAWLDLYLFGDGRAARRATSHEPLPEGSLIAAALERKSASRVGSKLGVEQGGVLVPEAVPVGKLRVGRFEVTRAQFAAFDPAYAVPAGHEDWPATGIDFAQAKAYAAWVAGKTGVAWRLPKVAEAEALAEKAGDGGNTFERWLGRGVNPDDATAARKAAGELELLLPVGSLKAWRPDPDSPGLFDLDGNAAEWAIDAKDKGESVGPSADRTLDANETADPLEAYRGLRLVADR